jgi:hypothetical protein
MSSKPAVERHLEALRALLRTLQPEQVAKAHEFWRAVRNTIGEQGKEIEELRNRVEGLQQQQILAAQALNALPQALVPPPRPASSASVYELRRQIDDLFHAQAQQEPDASRTIEVLADLDPAWALRFLEKQIDHSKPSSLGCWVQGNVPKHDTGYCQVNMRNTTMPNSPAKFNIAPFIHQVAVCAKGEGSLLRLTSRDRDASRGERYEVSHLCHNPACFNPDHVVVEESGENKARSTCKGHYVIKLWNGATIDPCVHWKRGVMRSCILPSVNMPADAAGKYLGFDPDKGPVIRTFKRADYED